MKVLLELQAVTLFYLTTKCEWTVTCYFSYYWSVVEVRLPLLYDGGYV